MFINSKDVDTLFAAGCRGTRAFRDLLKEKKNQFLAPREFSEIKNCEFVFQKTCLYFFFLGFWLLGFDFHCDVGRDGVVVTWPDGAWGRR